MGRIVDWSKNAQKRAETRAGRGSALRVDRLVPPTQLPSGGREAGWRYCPNVRLG